MRLRLVALLGSLALLAILGAPTLAMSLKEHVPTAPWQWSRGAAAVAAAPGTPSAGPSPGAGERTYLARMMVLHERTLDAARQLERSPRLGMRHLAAVLVAQRSAEVARMHRWLARWYPAEAEAVANGTGDLPALSGASQERALLRAVIGDRLVAQTLSRQLLAQHLAVHPAVARLALRIQHGGHAQLHHLQHWLAVDLRGPWPLGTGPRMMGR